MASAILLVAVLAVTTAVTAAQQSAAEAQQRVAASLAAHDLMGRLITTPYDDLADWDGFREEVGTLHDMKGAPAPPCFGGIGRSVTVTSEMHTIDDLGVRVLGSTVCVVVFDAADRALAELCTFVTEPPA